LNLRSARVLDAGDLSLKFDSFTLSGIGTATFSAILSHALLRQPRKRSPMVYAAPQSCAPASQGGPARWRRLLTSKAGTNAQRIRREKGFAIKQRALSKKGYPPRPANAQAQQPGTVA